MRGRSRTTGRRTIGRRRTIFGWLAPVALLALMLGCQRGEQTDPEDFAQNIERRIQETKLPHADTIDVDIDGKKVVLKGTVETDAHRKVIEETVKKVPGVEEIANELTTSGQSDAGTRARPLIVATEATLEEILYAVDGTPPAGGRQHGDSLESVLEEARAMDDTRLDPGGAFDQGENQKDREIAARVRQNLLKDRDLSFLTKNVTVISQGGRVTLQGEVPSARERGWAREAAEKVVGSSNVDNKIELVTPPTPAGQE